MAVEIYNLGDFSSGVAPDALQSAIEADATITVQVVSVSVGANVQIEFQATLDAGMKTALDAIVAAHDGQPLPDSSGLPVAMTGDGQRSDGILRVQLEPSTKKSKIRVKGFRLTPTLKASGGDPPMESHVDVPFDASDESLIDFQGIQGIWVEGHMDPDFMELLAMFPSTGTEAQWTAAGLGPWPFGAAPTPGDAGQGDILLSTFGVEVYLPPSGEIPPIIGEGTFTIPQPLFLRFCYYATGVDGADPVPNVTGMVRYWYDLA